MYKRERGIWQISIDQEGELASNTTDKSDPPPVSLYQSSVSIAVTVHGDLFIPIIKSLYMQIFLLVSVAIIMHCWA